jgi:hypothetical protein
MAELVREEEFPDTPEGWARRWMAELSASAKELEKWHEQGKRIDKRFRDERDGKGEDESRWNLFTANVQTQRALMYGKTPSVDVSRKFGDANDDLARVAGEMLERLCNCDIARDSDTYRDALEYCLMDRLLPGLAQARIRYVAPMKLVPGKPAMLRPDGTEEAPAVPDSEVKEYEDVEVDWVPWDDFRWSAGSRVWHLARWVAFAADMSRSALVKRFGKDIGNRVPLNATKKDADSTDKKADPWDRSRVWEVWSKEHKRVFWVVEGFSEVLDMKKDPLGLEGFFPCPRPLLANATTSSLVPRPDYVLAQDLYRQIDSLSTRITKLVESLKVAGAYDKKQGDALKRLVRAGENELIPVDNWAMFGEAGGLKGIVDWFPLEAVAATLTHLRDVRQELVATTYQVTGMSDILRGEAATPGATATEQRIKGRFASVRMQAFKDEFARFATDLQKLKAEVIVKQFDDATILERSNVQFTADAQMGPQAVQLLKSRFAHYRVEVKSDAIALADFAADKQEATEAVGALSQYFAGMSPIAQAMPGALPYLLEMGQAVFAKFKGFGDFESVFDRAIAAAKQAASQPAQPGPPDPKVQAAQLKMQSDGMKAQADMQREQMKVQGDLVRIRAETEAKAEQERNQAVANIAEARAKHALVKSDVSPAFTPGPDMPGGIS